jgi:hypothetical protein
MNPGPWVCDGEFKRKSRLVNSESGSRDMRYPRRNNLLQSVVAMNFTCCDLIDRLRFLRLGSSTWKVLTTVNQGDQDRAEQDEFESLVTDVAGRDLRTSVNPLAYNLLLFAIGGTVT